ncbi:MAG: hypothetical protein JNJ73_21015 [Hyphomonadaceae bacterium]|nr:hypothetical protein [Hyphomonadaceae bacterium]
MQSEVTGPMKYVILWFRLLFGAHLIYSGMRHFLGFEVLSGVTHPVGGPFVRIIAEMGIYQLVKLIELITGIMLFCGLFVPLVLVIEFPISVVIFILNFFIVAQPRQLFSGPQEIVLNGILLAFYGRYYMPLLNPLSPPRPIWKAKWSDTKLP